MEQAIRHEGFALIDILQNRVPFNKRNTFHWYKEHVYALEDGYDPTDRLEAFRRSLEWGKRIPTGIFYINRRPTFEQGVPVILEKPLVQQPFSMAAVRLGNSPMVRIPSGFCTRPKSVNLRAVPLS